MKAHVGMIDYGRAYPEVTLADLARAYAALGTVRPADPFLSDKRSAFTRGVTARLTAALAGGVREDVRPPPFLTVHDEWPAVPSWMRYRPAKRRKFGLVTFRWE